MNNRISSGLGRMQWIDLAKGMAIILVVFRHSIVGLDRAGLSVPPALFDLQEYMYNFRMPVFFALSGIFLQRSMNKMDSKTLMGKKVNTLLYPYLLWTFIFITIQVLFSKYTNSHRTLADYRYIFTQPRNLDHMWYLLCLFNTSILYLLLAPLFKSYKLAHLLLGISLYCFSYFVRDYSILSDLFYHYVFLLLGVLFSEFLVSESSASKSKHIVLTSILFPLFIFAQWSWQKLMPGNFELQIVFLMIIVLDCLFFFYFCNLLFLTGVLNFLLPVGKNSLPIYILHFIVIAFVRILFIKVFDIHNSYLILTVSMLFGITLPILVYELGKPYGIEYLFVWKWKLQTK